MRTTTKAPSAALTSFVVGSRYMPVYIALLLLVIVASIWAPATMSVVSLRAIAPYGAVLGITALGQMLVIMTGGIDLSVPGTMSLAAVIMVGVGEGSNEQITVAIATAHRRRRGGRTRQRHPDRRAQAEPAHRHPGGGSDRGRRGQSLRKHVPGPEPGADRVVRLDVDAPPRCQPGLLDRCRAHPRPGRRPSVHGGRSPVPGGGRQPRGLPRRRCPGERAPDPRVRGRRRLLRHRRHRAGGAHPHPGRLRRFDSTSWGRSRRW